MSIAPDPMIDRPGLAVKRLFSRHRGLVIAMIALGILFSIVAIISPGPISYFDVSFLSSGGATLAIAAMGETIVILSGGFDLSAGAVISLVNVLLAANMDYSDPDASVLLWTFAGIGIGAATGAFNGFFIAFLRLQPIVVTLSTMFILQGVTLLILDKPGGFVAPSIGAFYMGDAISEFLPMPLVLLGVLILVWLWLKNTRFGVSLYAVGSDPESARASGTRVEWTLFFVYVLAGAFYGLAGVFTSAQTGSGDPLVGNPLILSIFTAVVVGGTRLGGGRGGLVGSIFGAYILMIVVNILLVLDVSAYYSTIAEGVILILAVLGSSVTGDSVLVVQYRRLTRRLKAARSGQLPGQLGGSDRRLTLAPRHTASAAATMPGFWTRHADTLRYALPAYICFAGIILVTEFVLGNALFNWNYWNSLIVLSSFLAILALGQGTVILTGGLDLSVPWTIGFCGIVLAGIVQGSDLALIYVLPVVLALAACIGLINGLGIVMLGLSPIVMTLAMNGILQGAALIYSNGTPSGFSSPVLRAFMTSKVAGVTPVVLFCAVFACAAVLLLGRTPFGRRVYAIGNAPEAARLSGVNVDWVLISSYILSAVCAGIVGILLTGFSGQASLGMGEEYLLSSIAVVVVGGALITGGRGHYLGMLGGVLLLTALQTLLAGTSLPYAMRAILFGIVILGAVIALRERQIT